MVREGKEGKKAENHFIFKDPSALPMCVSLSRHPPVVWEALYTHRHSQNQDTIGDFDALIQGADRPIMEGGWGGGGDVNISDLIAQEESVNQRYQIAGAHFFFLKEVRIEHNGQRFEILNYG